MLRSTQSVDSLATAYKLPLHKDKPLLVTTTKCFAVQTELPALPPSPAVTENMETPPQMRPGLGEMLDNDTIYGPGEPMTVEKIEGKRRLEYLNNIYRYKEPPPARERLSEEAMVHVDVNTNVIVSEIDTPWGLLF